MGILVAVLVGAIVIFSRQTETEDLSCNGRDLFDNANANVVVHLVSAGDPAPTLNSLGARSFHVEQIMATRSERGAGSLDAHVRFTSDATRADADVFLENARLLPGVAGAELGACPLR